MLGLNGTAAELAFLSRSTPLNGSTAKRVGLNLAASQFHAFLYFSRYVPKRLTLKPKIQRQVAVTFQSS